MTMIPSKRQSDEETTSRETASIYTKGAVRYVKEARIHEKTFNYSSRFTYGAPPRSPGTDNLNISIFILFVRFSITTFIRMGIRHSHPVTALLTLFIVASIFKVCSLGGS